MTHVTTHPHARAPSPPAPSSPAARARARSRGPLGPSCATRAVVGGRPSTRGPGVRCPSRRGPSALPRRPGPAGATPGAMRTDGAGDRVLPGHDALGEGEAVVEDHALVDHPWAPGSARPGPRSTRSGGTATTAGARRAPGASCDSIAATERRSAGTTTAVTRPPTPQASEGSSASGRAATRTASAGPAERRRSRSRTRTPGPRGRERDPRCDELLGVAQHPATGARGPRGRSTRPNGSSALTRQGQPRHRRHEDGEQPARPCRPGRGGNGDQREQRRAVRRRPTSAGAGCDAGFQNAPPLSSEPSTPSGVSARAANAATPARGRLDAGRHRRQRPDGRAPNRGGSREPERAPPRTRGGEHTPGRQRADDEGVGPTQPACRQADRGRPHRRLARPDAERRHEQVRHRGIPEEHGPLAHDEPLEDERVPDRGDGGDGAAARAPVPGRGDTASRAHPRRRGPGCPRARGPVRGRRRAPSRGPHPPRRWARRAAPGVLVPSVNGVSRGSGDQARS